MAVVKRCPTGALKFIRKDDPLYVQGCIQINQSDGSVLLNDMRVAFCRCGATRHPPYCDGEHENIGFSAKGNKPPACPASEEVVQEGEILHITPMQDGPLMLRGSVKVHTADGKCIFQGNKAALCRCGASTMKPFCDGAHTRIGFKSQ